MKIKVRHASTMLQQNYIKIGTHGRGLEKMMFQIRLKNNVTKGEC